MDRVDLVFDANVLIDYASTDPSVLTLVVDHIGQVHVPRDVLEEVQLLDEEHCARLGMKVAEGTTEQIVEAGAGRGALSFADWMCLIIARENRWDCVTNDGALRRECEANGINVRWGLELLLDVVAAGGMSAAGSIACAEAIAANNAWLKPEVIERFRRKAGGP